MSKTMQGKHTVIHECDPYDFYKLECLRCGIEILSKKKFNKQNEMRSFVPEKKIEKIIEKEKKYKCYAYHF